MDAFVFLLIFVFLPVIFIWISLKAIERKGRKPAGSVMREFSPKCIKVSLHWLSKLWGNVSQTISALIRYRLWLNKSLSSRSLINICFCFTAQPVVTTTANVIYTIPTNDPSRFSSANISASASVHYGELNFAMIAINCWGFPHRSTAVLRSSRESSDTNDNHASFDSDHADSNEQLKTSVFRDVARCAKARVVDSNKW